MQIEVAKIEQTPLTGTFEIKEQSAGGQGFESFTVQHCVVSYELYRISDTEISFKATYDGSLKLDCTTCLDEYMLPVGESFSILFKIRLPELAGLITLNEKDGDIQFITEDTIDIEKQVLDAMQLDLPIAHQCKEDCKGICSSCGVNLNDGPCNCKQEKVDPRWHALESLLHKKE